MAKTKIEWADYTANAWRGCSRIALGCTHCYAATLATRFPATFGRWGTEQQGGVRVVADLDKLFKQVRGWDKKAACNCLVSRMSTISKSKHWPSCPQFRPPIVFWNDVSDTFDDWQGPLFDRDGDIATEQLPPGVGTHRDDPICLSGVRRRMFAEGIDANQNLTHVLLTKRPENVRGMWPEIVFETHPRKATTRTFRPNVWLLYSASDQATLESGLPYLLACRDLCPVLGLSLEPLVGAVDLNLAFERIAGNELASRRPSAETYSPRRPGDHGDWRDLENARAEGRSGKIPGSETQGRAFVGSVFPSQGDGKRRSLPCLGASRCVDLSKRRNSERNDDQSQGWPEDKQSSEQSGTRNSVRAGDSRQEGARQVQAGQRTEQQRQTQHAGSGRNTESQVVGGTFEVDCSGFRSERQDCIKNRPWPPLGFVIVGGESGPNARPCNVEWIRSIVRQCRNAGVPCFVKQLGANVIDANSTMACSFPDSMCWPDGFVQDGQRIRLRDSKGGDPAEWPEDLRVREFPR